MDRKKIVGECSCCASCCHFSYWAYGSNDADMAYHQAYAKRYFSNIEFRPGVRVGGSMSALIVVPSVPCQHLDPKTNLCKLHDSSKKPRDCVIFPFNIPLSVFEKIRFKDCGFTVESVKV